jgi:hypothetical protein
MKTLMIKDLSRDEDLNPTAMAEVRGGLNAGYTRPARYYVGMTEGYAINEFVAHTESLHNYLSNQS